MTTTTASKPLEFTVLEPGFIEVAYDVKETHRVIRTQLRKMIEEAGPRRTQFSLYIGKYSSGLFEELQIIAAKYEKYVKILVIPANYFGANAQVEASYEMAYRADFQDAKKKLAFIARAYAGDEVNAKPRDGGAERNFTMAELQGRLAAVDDLIRTIERSLGKRKLREPEKAELFVEMEEEIARINAQRDQLSLRIATRKKATKEGEAGASS